jgi:hypothetical protein
MKRIGTGPSFVRHKELAEIFGTPALVRRMLRFKWLKPCVKRHRMSLYRVHDVEECLLRLSKGEYPS